MIWAPGRNTAQGLRVADLYQQARGVACEHSAVMAGGLPGADKIAALTQARVDRGRYLTVSIDTVLVAMAAHGLILEVEGLSPLEAADLAHTEAQFVAKWLTLRALADGRNLLLEITMASRVSLESWLDTLHRAGYVVTGVLWTSASPSRCAAARPPTGAGTRSTGPAAATAAASSHPRRSGRWLIDRARPDSGRNGPPPGTSGSSPSQQGPRWPVIAGYVANPVGGRCLAGGRAKAGAGAHLDDGTCARQRSAKGVSGIPMS